MSEGLQPRGLSRLAAAAYCGLSGSGFDHWVATGRLPGPIPNTHRWDRKAIDLALDKLSKIETTMPSAYDQWKAGKHARVS
jgi:predicted DNA-binding transcriptional regulator AlpA